MKIVQASVPQVKSGDSTLPPPTYAYIYYNPERVDYSLTGEELEKICEMGRNSWKDFCLVSFSLGLPCLINAVAEFSRQPTFSPTVVMALNALVGFVEISLAVCFGIQWRRSKKNLDAILENLKHKPKLPITTQEVNQDEAT